MAIALTAERAATIIEKLGFVDQNSDGTVTRAELGVQLQQYADQALNTRMKAAFDSLASVSGAENEIDCDDIDALLSDKDQLAFIIKSDVALAGSLFAHPNAKIKSETRETPGITSDVINMKPVEQKRVMTLLQMAYVGIFGEDFDSITGYFDAKTIQNTKHIQKRVGSQALAGTTIDRFTVGVVRLYLETSPEQALEDLNELIANRAAKTDEAKGAVMHYDQYPIQQKRIILTVLKFLSPPKFMGISIESADSARTENLVTAYLKGEFASQTASNGKPYFSVGFTFGNTLLQELANRLEASMEQLTL